jgi:hypothetical protein
VTLQGAFKHKEASISNKGGMVAPREHEEVVKNHVFGVFNDMGKGQGKKKQDIKLYLR